MANFPKTQKELIRYIHTAGKRANERLRQLELAGLEEASVAYRKTRTQFADKKENPSYAPWLEATKSRRTEKAEFRFRTSTRNLQINDLRTIASRIYLFLEAKTTVKQVETTYMSSYRKYVQNHPEQADLSFADYSEYMSAGLIEHFKSIYGSDEVVKLREKTLGKLNSDEIEMLLESAGFNYDTVKGTEPDLGPIYSLLEDIGESLLDVRELQSIIDNSGVLD